MINQWHSKKKESSATTVTVTLGAENESRTRDLNLGKVALYQLSYFRKILCFLGESECKVRKVFFICKKILQKMAKKAGRPDGRPA